jgi:hypothetical protein
VATAVGGTQDLITDRVHGLIVPRRDPDALAAAMLEDARRSAGDGTRVIAARRRWKGLSFDARMNAVERIYELAALRGNAGLMAASSREALKAIAHGVALVLVTPALLSFWVRSWILGRDRSLEHSTQALGLIPGLIGQYLRRAFLRHTLAYCDPSALIEFGTIFSAAGTRIDAHVYLGPYCAIGLVHFEHDVMVAPAVQIPSGRLTHGISDPTTPMRDQADAATGRIGAMRRRARRRDG